MYHKKAGVTDHLRELNLYKVSAAAASNIFVYKFSLARTKYDVACACGTNSVRSKDAHKQLARKSQLSYAILISTLAMCYIVTRSELLK